MTMNLQPERPDCNMMLAFIYIRVKRAWSRQRER